MNNHATSRFYASREEQLQDLIRQALRGLKISRTERKELREEMLDLALIGGCASLRLAARRCASLLNATFTLIPNPSPLITHHSPLTPMLPHPALSLLERPILFSGEMVRAILDGRKTQTRRVRMFRDKPSRFQVGMRLWVRETWADTTGMGLDEEGIVYRATDPDWSAYEGFKWRPSIFMPRYASRITLQIIQVRVERVQEISAEDALAEGFGHATKPEGPHRAWVPRRLFSRYWDELNAKRGYGWETNPRVWAISFRRPVRWPARR